MMLTRLTGEPRTSTVSEFPQDRTGAWQDLSGHEARVSVCHLYSRRPRARRSGVSATWGRRCFTIWQRLLSSSFCTVCTTASPAMPRARRPVRPAVRPAGTDGSGGEGGVLQRKAVQARPVRRRDARLYHVGLSDAPHRDDHPRHRHRRVAAGDGSPSSSAGSTSRTRSSWTRWGCCSSSASVSRCGDATAAS